MNDGDPEQRTEQREGDPEEELAGDGGGEQPSGARWWNDTRLSLVRLALGRGGQLDHVALGVRPGTAPADRTGSRRRRS